MTGSTPATDHSAEGAALGFWYQSLYALLMLAAQSTDDAAVGVEQLDDIELTADGHTLLYQLKHSIDIIPPPVSIKSRALWRTVKVWRDVLPKISLSETTLCLVTVGGIVKDDPLWFLTDPAANRTDLLAQMTAEAERVTKLHGAAFAQGKPAPFADRLDGCRAFLDLQQADRLNLLRRVVIKPNSPPVGEIEAGVAALLHILPVAQRNIVAQRLVEWWDRQVVYSLCGKRARIISRIELQSQIMAIVSDLDQGRLTPDFETLSHPEEYQPDGMLSRQIALVNGSRSDLIKAIQQEWKAREQRSRWIDSNPAMRSKINDYDQVLQNEWSDRHIQLIEDCEAVEDAEKCSSGLELLRWTHNEAPNMVRPFAEGWVYPYYIRGTYQVLSIDLRVGWHPDYASLLGDAK